jgi:nitronate monooxygenase
MALPAALQRLRLPAIAAPLFIISNPEMVIAGCQAGMVTAFPSLNARPPHLLDEWMPRTPASLPRPTP